MPADTARHLALIDLYRSRPVFSIRAPAVNEWAAARALFAAESTRHQYAERVAELMTAAANGSAEYQVAVAADPDGELVGAIVYGLTAGAAGAGALYGVAVTPPRRRTGAGRSLVRHAARELRARGARFALAELPDDPAMHDVLALLAADGFVEEARVADFYRDGVAQAFMRRNFGSP
jgi:ribosomal protein S18 acetylase RimI-like enzyme